MASVKYKLGAILRKIIKYPDASYTDAPDAYYVYPDWQHKCVNVIVSMSRTDKSVHCECSQ